MTITHVETGYLETPYLENPYLGADVNGYMGQQAKFTIAATKPMGMQCNIVIQNFPRSLGQQASLHVADHLVATGQQAHLVIGASKALGEQAKLHINNHLVATGQQANIQIANAPVYGEQANLVLSHPRSVGQQAHILLTQGPAYGMQAHILVGGIGKSLGMQYEQTNIVHEDCGGYLEDGYLEDQYLSHGVCAHGGHQAEFVTTQTPAYGMQAEFHIANRLRSIGEQAQFHINDHLSAYGQQANFLLTKTPAYGMQALFNIANRLRSTGEQAQFVINQDTAYGMQAEIIQLAVLGMQATISLYNTNRLRILCDFPSRGLSSATGNNSWGFPAGQGQSWKSNSTEAGDFSPFNLNTDIVEETWRSNAPTVTGINLSCDTERTQGVFLDTFAILNHNITTSATVTLVGSSSPTFSTIGISIPLEPREDDPNIYYIAPTLPNVGYRYWRISIDDATNPDGFVSIGTVIFGAARIFFGECFVDQVEFQLKDYTSSVHTEAFTNVNNARAQRKILKLDFRSLSYLKSNFRLMRSMFRNERTVLKCLWLPTPSPLNQEYTARFAMFAKLTQIPNESHNHKGGDADYVTFTIDLDESN